MLMLRDRGTAARSWLIRTLLTVLVISLTGCRYAPAAPARATPRIAVTPWVVPSDTPVPTATRRPSPTATPTVPPPTATPTPVPAGADSYVAEMEPIARDWEEFRSSADALIVEVGQSFFAICLTRSGEIDEKVLTGRELLQRVEAVEPPQEVAEAHNQLIESGEAGLAALEEGKAALCQRLDTALALQKVEESNQHLVEAYAASQALLDWVEAQGPGV